MSSPTSHLAPIIYGHVDMPSSFRALQQKPRVSGVDFPRRFSLSHRTIFKTLCLSLSLSLKSCLYVFINHLYVYPPLSLSLRVLATEEISSCFFLFPEKNGYVFRTCSSLFLFLILLNCFYSAYGDAFYFFSIFYCILIKFLFYFILIVGFKYSS